MWYFYSTSFQVLCLTCRHKAAIEILNISKHNEEDECC